MLRSLTNQLKLKCGQCRFYCTRNPDGKSFEIGFIGLGNMGSSMSKNLVKKGFNVTVYDINSEASRKIEKFGARVANSSEELVKNVDCVITMLPASPQVRSLYSAEKGILKHIKQNTLIIDTSTIDPSVSTQISVDLQNVGAKFVDAPVSGGVKAAELGTLTFMVGGDSSVVDQAKPILLAMGQNVIHCGPIGSGEIAKACNNLLLAISMAGVSEAMNLGIRLGLEPELLASVINRSSGRCWSSELYNPVPGVIDDVPSSRDYKPGFTSQMILKDLNIAENAARESAITLNFGKKALELYQDICNKNLGDKDFSIVYKHLSEQK